MKPSELMQEIELFKKQPRRVRLLLLIATLALAAVPIAFSMTMSYCGAKGKRLAELQGPLPTEPGAAQRQHAGRQAGGVTANAATPSGDHGEQTRIWKVDTFNSPSRGSTDAPLTVVEFMDFEGPHCKTVDEALRRLERDLPGKIRRVYKSYPLAVHVHADLAARAALAASALDQFWPMHDALFESQDRLDGPAIEALAIRLGMNRLGFLSALAKVDRRTIEQDVKQGRALGLQGVPTVFINGLKFYGEMPYERYLAVARNLLGMP
jgi:protein-disulfide isomerase